MKLFIIGHGRHGKDTVAEIIRDQTGMKFSSSSWHVCERSIWPAIQRDEPGRYDDIEACYADRHNRRKEWFDWITDYNTPDRSRLSREIFEVADIYVGIRNREEFLAAKGLAGLAIWIDAPERKPAESRNSITIRRGDADIVIDNNGSESELWNRVVRFSRLLSAMNHAETMRRQNDYLRAIQLPYNGLNSNW